MRGMENIVMCPRAFGAIDWQLMHKLRIPPRIRDEPPFVCGFFFVKGGNGRGDS